MPGSANPRWESREEAAYWFKDAADIARFRIQHPEQYTEKATNYVDVLCWVFSRRINADWTGPTPDTPTEGDDGDDLEQQRLVTDGGRSGEETQHMPWDDPWHGVGVPPRHSFWTEERIEQADQLVSDLLATDYDRVIRDGLSAEHKIKNRVYKEDVPLVVVSNEYNEVLPIKYDNRHLTGMSTKAAIRRARGDE